MKEKIDCLIFEIKNFTINNNQDLEKFRKKFLNKKGVLNEIFLKFSQLDIEQKKKIGSLLNNLKNVAKDKFITANKLLSNKDKNSFDKKNILDITLPPNKTFGLPHPLIQIQNKVISIFEQIGFTLSEGPEIENEWYNFNALNIPEHHPARAMQDTFFLKEADTNKNHVLRTQTSSVQIRVMESHNLPIRTISIGRVYRNEDISARAHCIFHQIEGITVNKNVNLKDLKETLFYFVKNIFGKKTKIRLRPSYFPFTEPSSEVDISCTICSGKKCKICKYTGWVELGGAGLVDPNVLKNCKIDSRVYTGFAFGLGIERLAMLIYRIDDLRLFTENNLDFLQQFKNI